MTASDDKSAARDLRATYRIVTPLFCGGAEQQAEFRLASFKGVLRFWWRALEWGRIQDLAAARLPGVDSQLAGVHSALPGCVGWSRRHAGQKERQAGYPAKAVRDLVKRLKQET